LSNENRISTILNILFYKELMKKIIQRFKNRFRNTEYKQLLKSKRKSFIIGFITAVIF